MLQVFGQPASTDVARVMACLLERQLEFELVRTDTFKRGRNNKLPELVKMRARSQIPPKQVSILSRPSLLDLTYFHACWVGYMHV